MAQSPSYAQLLRPVGQMLEGLEVESFVLQVEGDDFIVQGRQRARKSPQAQEKTLRVVWQILRGREASPKEPAAASAGALELRYTRDDVARMEREGQSRRREPGQTPEAHGTSQILRAVGAFVDHKGGRFLAVSKRDQNVTIEYQSPLNRKVVDELTVSSLYDFWVRMYLRRGKPSPA